MCCTPPKKETMVDKYIAYCAQHQLPHGITKEKPNYPDKEYLILLISTFSAGKDEIFERNYYPVIRQPRVNSTSEFFLNNADGLLTNIPYHLLGSKGSRTMKLTTLSKEDRLRLKMAKAEELMQKQSERKAKLERELQTQKITKALFGDSQQFDAAKERERIREEMQKHFEESAAQFVRNKESEMQAEFQRQLALAQLSDGSQMLLENSAHSSKQATKNARAGGRTLAPFPNTIHNQAEIGEETFENLMQ